MDLPILILTAIILLSWGLGSFFAKLATNRIGEKAVFFDIIAYFLSIVIYSLIVFKTKNLFVVNKLGALYGFLAGLIGSFGLISFYILLNKAEASVAVPLTTLYPGITVILAFIFLHKTITLPKILGIIFSLIAIYLLNK